MKIIMLSGKAEAGKDLSATIMKERFEAVGKRVLIVHFADYLKFIAKEYYGWNGLKNQEGRKLLQELGTNVIRRRQPTFWAEIIASLIDVIGCDFDFVLIPDARFEDELLHMSFSFNTIEVNVVRVNYENSLTAEQRKHPSETNLDDYDFDYYIISETGKEKLSIQVDRFIEKSGILKEV